MIWVYRPHQHIIGLFGDEETEVCALQGSIEMDTDRFKLMSNANDLGNNIIIGNSIYSSCITQALTLSIISADDYLKLLITKQTGESQTSALSLSLSLSTILLSSLSVT